MSPAPAERTAASRIVCVGAGPAGLFFAILAKRRDPDAEVTVLERCPEGVTYGWGVTLSEDGLDSLYAGDPKSAAEIERDLASWGDQLVCLGDQRAAHLGGYGFAIGRHRLLEILAARAVELGVRVDYRHEVTDLAELAGADLVLVADGAHSGLRERHAEWFGAQREPGRNYYIWLGTHRVFGEFRYAFEHTDAGWIWFYAYPFDERTTTFIVECAPEVWKGLGYDHLGPEETRASLETIFARHLDGQSLLMQTRDRETSPWLRFNWVSVRSWCHGNLVLAGDAAHTTHFSIGNGTKLAIDDVLELDRQLAAAPDLATALQGYQRERARAVDARRRFAYNSADWFERVERFTTEHPAWFAYLLRCRGQGDGVTPGGLLWLLHLATQLAPGRLVRGWVTSGRHWWRCGRRRALGWGRAPDRVGSGRPARDGA
jgi:anthraniloyl-CoA monooxygenase